MGGQAEQISCQLKSAEGTNEWRLFQFALISGLQIFLIENLKT